MPAPGTSVTARAVATGQERALQLAQQATLRAVGDAEPQTVVEDYVAAITRGYVEAVDSRLR